MIYLFVVSFTLGIAFESVLNLGLYVGLLVLVLSVFLPLVVWREDAPLAEKFFVIGIALCIGIFRIIFVDSSPDPSLLQSVGEKISFEAIISAEPDLRDDSARYTVSVAGDSLDPQSMKCLASATGASTRNFSAEKYPCISEAAAEKNLKSLVLLVADRFPELEYGDKIKVSGKLDLPKNFLSREARAKWDGVEFDYINYLAKDKIHFLIYRPQIEKIGNEGNAAISFLYSLKNIFIEKIGKVVPEPNSSLLSGILFGSKQSLGEELLNDFKKVGLVHMVVLSGYNITIIAAGVFFFVSFWGKRRLGFAVSAVSIVLFSVMVGLGATVIRACIMALIAILARFLGRPSDALRWLFVAGFLMLLWNPLILFHDPSFQLSFMATLGLVLFSPFIFSFISRSRLRKFIPEKLGLREIVSSTLAVQFFVLPILIKMSGFISLVSFIANPLILPLVPGAMALGALTGALGALPFLGHILSWPFGALAYIVTQIMISVTEFSADIPFATLQTGSISLFLILLWYAGYEWAYWKLKKHITPNLLLPQEGSE